MSDFYSINPSDESLIASHQACSFEHIDNKLTAMTEDVKDWKLSDFDYRVSIVKAFAEELKLQKEQCAQLISMEMGKLLSESLLEVQGVINKCDLSTKAFTERTVGYKAELSGKTQELAYKPLGNLLVLGPYNFPAHLPMGHIIPALLAGNCIIFKPSEYCNLTAEFLINCWRKVGLPDYVLTLVKGGRDQGQYLVSHQHIQGVLFTGSHQGGKAIAQSLSNIPERLLALEMGGNNPLVIDSFDDAHAVIQLIIRAAYLSSGQRCTCARRLILIDNDSKDDFVSQLIQAINAIRIGAYNDDVFMGPLATKQAEQSVLAYYDQLLSLGAVPLVEMNKLKQPGFYLSPALLDVTGIVVPDEECFGPLLQLIRVSSLDEAIRVSNQTQYGLSASIISKSRDHFDRFFKQVNAGVINWNQPTNGAASSLPFGGIGKSGNYRPAAYFAADYCSYPVASVQADSL